MKPLNRITPPLAATAVAIASLNVATPAMAAPRPAPPIAVGAAPTARTVKFSETSSHQDRISQYVEMAVALRQSGTPRTILREGDLEVIRYSFEDRVFISIPYVHGQPYVADPPRGISQNEAPTVTFGVVWWSAYVELSPAEQAALAAGVTTGVVSALLKNPVAAGIATTIVTVATAEGVCPGGRRLRIYIPSFLMSECRR